MDNGAGGKDVGAFKASVTLPARVEWTNSGQIGDVRRSDDLTLIWKTANPANELVTIVAVSGLRSGTTSGAMCTESAAAGRMTIPSWILSALLPTEEEDGIPLGYLVVASSPLDSASQVNVPGMDASVLQYIDAKAKLVRFR